MGVAQCERWLSVPTHAEPLNHLSHRGTPIAGALRRHPFGARELAPVFPAAQTFVLPPESWPEEKRRQAAALQRGRGGQDQLVFAADGAINGTLVFCIVSLKAGTSFARTSRHFASCVSSC